MSEKIFCCQKCSKLFFGEAPARCTECGSDNIRQGLEALTFEAKRELAALRRAEANEKVKKSYSLKPRRK